MDKRVPQGVTAMEVEHVARVMRATLFLFAQGMAGAPTAWARGAVGAELDEARGRLADYERAGLELREMEAPRQRAQPTAIERWRARTERRARDGA
jgi:hypothetical protein